MKSFGTVPLFRHEGGARFVILWPEQKVVSGQTIQGWYEDAVANAEVEDIGRLTPDQMALELHNAGLITLGRAKCK